MNLRELEQHVPTTYRQLDYWRRKGWFGADCANPGSGTGRGDLTEACLRRALILSAGVHAGVKLPVMVNALAVWSNEELLKITEHDGIQLKGLNGLHIMFMASDIPGWADVVPMKES